MKKKNKLFLTLVLAAISTSLMGCNKQQPQVRYTLTYGNIRSNDITLVEQLGEYTNKDDLYSRIDSGETFLLSVYDDFHTSCQCWPNLQERMIYFANDYHIDIRYISVSQLVNNPYGIFTGRDNMPSIVSFSGGRLTSQILYSKDPRIFMLNDYFLNYISNLVDFPKMYYVDKTYVENRINNNDEFNLYVMRSGCPDCGLISKDVLPIWNANHINRNENLYIFDIESYRSDSVVYQTLKDYLGLSLAGDPLFGYDHESETTHNITSGMLPTFQHRKGTQIKDMITVLNEFKDTANKKLFSYFTTERVAAMSFLTAAQKENTVFNGMDLTDEQVTSEGFERFKLEFYPNYHYPLVNQFLDYYLL